MADNTQNSTNVDGFRRAKHNFERTFVTELLQQHGGNVKQAANAIHTGVHNLYNAMKRHNINPESFHTTS